MMVWSKRLAMLAACFAFAACQTQAKKKAPTDTKKPTKTMSKDGTGKPAAPIEEKKPAESFQEVAKNVKEAAQEYLDARAEEKLNPPEMASPEATKIEEVSETLDGYAETLVEMPEEEIVENISNEDGVALIADEIESQEENKKSKNGGVFIGAGIATFIVASTVGLAIGKGATTNVQLQDARIAAKKEAFEAKYSTSTVIESDGKGYKIHSTSYNKNNLPKGVSEAKFEAELKRLNAEINTPTTFQKTKNSLIQSAVQLKQKAGGGGFTQGWMSKTKIPAILSIGGVIAGIAILTVGVSQQLNLADDGSSPPVPAAAHFISTLADAGKFTLIKHFGE